MKQYLTPIRCIAFLLILAKSIAVGSALAEKSVSNISVVLAVVMLILLFSLLYFSLEFGIRYFIWPLASNLPLSRGISHYMSTRSISQKEELVVAEETNTIDTNSLSAEEMNPIDNPKVQAVINYTYETFQNILYPEELSSLISNIKSLILGKPYYDNVVDRKIPKLRSTDLYHFGWNLSRHLQIDQKKLAIFIKSQFSFPLRDSEVDTIYKKMGLDSDKDTLPRIEPDQPLLPFPLAEKLGLVS